MAPISVGLGDSLFATNPKPISLRSRPIKSLCVDNWRKWLKKLILWPCTVCVVSLSSDGINAFDIDVKSPACPSMVSFFSACNRVFLRLFPCMLHNPRPTWFLCCLGTVGRWRLLRYTVSAGSPMMWAGLWSNVTSVRTGFTAGMYIIVSSR